MPQKRDTINPYFLGLNLFYHRLLWDIHPCSWSSRIRIRKWKNLFYGKKAIILCNGPSLKKVDFDLLTVSGIFTFGLNKINILFSHTNFRPSCIVAVNPYIIEQSQDFFNITELPLFLDSRSHKLIEFRSNVHFLHSNGIKSNFARDCSISVNQGYTVTYVAMQLSFHMGFKTVALVGCDHYFKRTGRANETATVSRNDPDHFDSNYFSIGQTWQFPDIAGTELHYQIAGDTFAKYGRSLVNCTEGGKLEVFERQSLSEFIGSDI